MIYIETPRLLLRDWKEVDTPLFQSMNSNPLTMEFFLDTLSIEELNDIETLTENIKELYKHPRKNQKLLRVLNSLTNSYAN